MKKKANWDDYTAQLVSKKGAAATDLQLLSSYAHGCVLDAGCGTGIHIGRLATVAGVQETVGVDLGTPGLNYGKEKFPQVTFIEASLYQLPLPDDHFDLVYSLEVVEHLEKPNLAIKELYRVCKPGGFVLIQTPNYPIKRVYDIWYWLLGYRDSFSDDPTHVYFFNALKLKKMVVDSGLQVVHLSARNIAFQRFLPKENKLHTSWLGHHLGQKMIIIAGKS
ncbi:methyltransferase domain-containing protein [Lyngbya aestuarii]|uniref:methyltransferase domain-containing protein n=1 Tax=Lyngbya aestuarii TaxID=118322 RepID=UPI00403DA19B